ncbi:mucin-17-like isoform X3 [Chironomus tepperi]|uniref:mucin-17-like isoform X3 n=1 Tax=Chironomus tepperi TaxID=113505 RepID=UPI00391F06AA
MASDLSYIKDEDLLRQMWQETEDFGRKKEIRSHMYKLREARLREFYVNEMDPNNQQSFDAKTPITSRHGNAMADHSFESLKSNEIHGTDMSDIKFGNTGGWNVITSSEVSDDGKARTDKMLAKTEGVTAVKGGQKAFSGKNEELKTERFDGDANNFTHTTGESSNMVLNENIVTGDDTNKRTESKSSSSVSHSTKTIRTSNNTGDVSGNMVGNDNFHNVANDYDSRRSSTSTVKSSSHYDTQKSNVNENVKLSQDPAVVQEALRLAQQPGNVLSRKVERANESTNMITERKELSDGTIVTTKRFEPISSQHVDIQATTTTSNTQRDNKTTNVNKHQTETVNQSRNTETSNTTTRNEEAFRLAQQPGNIISRDVKQTDANTRMIIEKKELSDGTIVTSKRYEKISNDRSDDNARSENITRTSTTSTNQTFKTSRDEEAFKLAQQPGKIISRDVTMANPTTRQIVEKKELNDGTIVTTKRFESVDSSNDTKTSTTSITKDRQNDDFSKSLRTDSKTTKVDTTYKTSRDEEAFRLADQPGKIISRDVTMANPTTRQIVEKKELHDGTIVTTKRFENIDSTSDTRTSTNSVTKERQNDDFTKSLRTDTNTTKVDTTTYRTPKDEEAFRLAEQPGKILSRDVTMANPTTRQIVEKKELHDGTIVTTKRFENIDSTSDTRTSTNTVTKERQNDDFTKSLRTDTNTTKVDTTTYRTPKDEEAFRLAEQPGKILSRDVTMANPTTRQIVEKKELHDGTVVTTKRFERIDDTQSKNVKNVENVQNVKIIHTTTQQAQPRSDDYSTNREIVEEAVTKKIFDTSCQCPTAKDKHDHKTRDFIQNERNTEKYDVTTEIIVQQNDKRVVNEIEKTRDEINRREEVRKLEQKRIDDQIKQQKDQKITRQLEVDAAHKAFASSLRSVTPPPDRSSTNRLDRRSPSRETNSRYSSSTISTKRSSNVDIRKEDNTKHTNSLDRRTVTKSPEKYSSLDRRTPTKSPEKYPSIDRRTTPKSQDKVPTTERRTSSHSPDKYPSSTPDKQPQSKNVTSVTETTTRETTHSTVRDRDDKPKASSPQKPTSDKPRTPSPQKPSHESPKTVSSTKQDIKKTTVTKTVTNESDEEIIISKKHQVTPEVKPRETSPVKGSTPRATSPQKPASSQPNDKLRSTSPQKHPSAPFETYPRETSPVKSIPSNSREASPQKYQPGKSHPRGSSPARSSPSNSRDVSPQKHQPGKSYPRGSSPARSSPSNSRDVSPQKHQPGKSHPRGSSPARSSPSNSRDVSPQKHQPGKSYPRGSSPSDSRDPSPQKHQPGKSYPRGSSPSDSRDPSPQKHQPGKSHPRGSSPARSSPSNSRDVSPQKHQPGKSYPRGSSPSDSRDPSPQKHQPGKSYPRGSSPSDSRDPSPQKHQPGKSHPRGSSPARSSPSNSRDVSPQKHQPGKSHPRGSSPARSSPSDSRDPLPQKHQPGKSHPRGSSPARSSPSDSRDASPQKYQPGKSHPRGSSPARSSPSHSRETSPQKYQPSPTGTYPRESTPVKSTPSSRGTSPQKQTTSLPRDFSPSKPSKRPNYDDNEQDAPEDILTATIKIDNIDKTINDLKIIQTIDSKNMSATTSVSDLEYISASDHRKMITDLDNEDIEININIENVDQYDDFQVKTTISEIVDDKTKVKDGEVTKTPKGDKRPFNRSETFEERAKKLIGVKPDEEPKDIPNYLKPTKASQAPGRVSEIRERKAKIEEIEKSSVTTTNKRKSLTSATTDFIKHEKIEHAPASTPERSPTRKQPTESKKPKDRLNDDETTNITSTTVTTKSTNVVHKNIHPKRPEDKPETNRNVPDDRKPSRVRETVDITETTRGTRRETDSTEITKGTRRETDIRETTTRGTTRETDLTETTRITGRKGSRSPTRPKSPETHITTAQITISPSRGVTSKIVTKTTTVQSNKNLKVAPHIKLLKQNTDISSTEPESDRDTDHELIRNIDKPGTKSTKKKLLQTRKDTAPVTKTTSIHDKEKVTRTFSEKIIKNDKKGTVEKPRESPKKESKRPVKCITTKTINLTNINGDTTTLHSNTLDNVEVDINVQHAKSSREPSPNKVVPIPVQTDDEVNEEHILHPHKVTEPDDGRKTKPAVRNVPIFQEETNQFVGLEITEVGTEKGHTIIEEEEFEETERIINSSTLEKADRKRNSVQIDALSEDDEEEHSHLLSVSQKVNKFNETVDQLKKPKTSSKFKKDDDYKLEDVPDDVDDDAKLSLNEKVSKFSKITNETKTVTKQKLEDTLTTSIDEVDENLKNDECLLSVTDKVNKFIASAEKIGTTTPQKSPELVKNIMKQTSKHVRDKIENINDSFMHNEKMSTLERDTKTNLKSSEITLKSTEAIKKAREVFETNSSTTREINRQSDILSRPSVFEGKRTPVPERKLYEKPVQEKPVHERTPDRQSPLKDTDTKPSSRRGSSDRTPIYMKDQVSTKKDLFEKRISSSKLDSETSYHKPLSQQSSIEEKYTTSITSEEIHHPTRKMSSSDKHYMQHTVSSLEHVARAEIRESELSRTAREGYETRRDSTRSTSKQPSEPRDEIPESPRSPTKFGVELKKTDSFKTSTSTTSSTRKVSLGSETINIEEIFDLYELEKLLEIVVGYEQRRRIRAQIRIVKKKIEDSKSASELKSSRITTTKTTTRNEPVIRKQVTERKTSEKFKAPRDDESRVKTSVTTTTTTTTRISGDKEPKVISKTTKVTSTASPRTIIETFNKNNKGKVTESVVKNIRKTSATSSTQKSSTMRESCSKTCCDETDCITSSYGVGPTENGVPLFGLKALKKKSPAVVESKTTGTVVSEVSYSENGGPAVVQRKTTKYSSDPSDFSGETGVNTKSKSVTERKDSRGGIYSVTKVEKFESDKKSTPRVIRNGSVKEIKEKFVRKDSSSKMSRSESKRSSVDHHDSDCCSVSKTVRSSQSSETKSFLNNDKKATSVKEVITYMRNADEVIDDGDTKEDAEAKALLNKFFGASALMTTIESSSGLTKDYLSTGSAKTKTKSSASKATTKTVTSHSSSGSTKAYDINDIWDVDLLKKILDSATNYDDRRKIRERIRQVMADKEACAELVKNLSADLEVESNASSSGSSLHRVSDDKVESTEEGESSLLLSLLPGILQNPKYRNLSARQILTLNLSRAIAQQSKDLATHNSPTKMNRHDFPIEDSGTESGEDLRLLAANIQNNIGNHMEDITNNNLSDNTSEEPEQQKHVDTLGTDLLTEVTAALEKLQQSMNLGEIDLDQNKKTALLSLVNRLQIGLISNDKKVESNIESADSAVSVTSPMSPEKYGESNDVRRGSGGNVHRFNKRKNRANRHTVGVTREELADARRIIEELKFIEVKNVEPVPEPKVTATFVNSAPGVYNGILTRQISEPITLLRPSQFVPKEAQVNGQGTGKHKVLFKQSVSLDHPVPILKNVLNKEIVPKIDRNLSGGSSNNSVNNKFINHINKVNDARSDESSSSDDEDDDQMINTKYYNNKNLANTQNGKFRAKETFLRNQQIQEQLVEKSLNYSSGDESRDTSNTSRQPKYMSKKMKMKRANTVDIPKSYSFVNTFDLMHKDTSDNETSSNTYQNRTNAGLKTTFTAGNAPNPPKFTAKTENDKKFLAFIQKQNANVVPTYVNPTAKRNEPKTLNWTNKFGNLKTKFEDTRTGSPPAAPKTSNAAANFWKNIEKDKPSAMVSPLPAVPIKNSQPYIKNLPVSTEKFPWKNVVNEEPKIIKSEEAIIAKKKPLADKFVPKEQPPAPTFKSIPEPNKLPVLKPTTVNNFSHAPLSAFKPPISRKLSNNFKPIQNTEEVVKKPMPTITNGLVKQMAETGYNINDTVVAPTKKLASSPTRSIATFDTTFKKVSKPAEPKTESKPWAGQPKSDKVLSLAASKFENVPTVHFGSRLEEEPTVRFRSNPLYNGTFEKRSSLPTTAHLAQYNNSFDPIQRDTKNTTSLILPKEATFVITDFTQPTSVSTFAPSEEIPTIFKPTLQRQDSLTNPSKEPLVLTCDRSVISPREPKPVEFIASPPIPTSPQISNDHSIGSICDDLEHELDDLGDSIECQAAVSKVMKAPIAQTAYTQSSELTSLGGQKKENIMIQSLHDSLKKLQQKSPTPEKKQNDGMKRLSQDSSNSSIDFKILKTPAVPDTHNESHSRLSQDSSNSSIDLKLPPLKIPIAAVPETAYSIVYKSPPRIQVKSPSTDPPQSHILFNNVSSKGHSTHSLSVPIKPPVERSITPPGMYGVPQHLIDAKQKTVSSYLIPTRTESLKIKPISFSVGSKQSQPATRKISLQVKPMMSTSTKTVIKETHKTMGSLSRSKTMPSLAKVELLDESNIDDAFEELLTSSNL